jgi:GTPase SAR1 family protein
VAIFVYDITVRSSFENLEKWYKMVTDIANPAIFVVGNKVDLEEQREIGNDEGKKWAESHGGEFLETSAKAPVVNIAELFGLIAKMKTEGTATGGSASEQNEGGEGTEIVLETAGNKGKGSKCC